MASNTVTSYASLLKQIWQKGDINNLLYDNMPAWAMMPKKTDYTGRLWHLPLGYGTTQGDGPVFQTAQANKTPTVEAEFQITLNTYYSLFSVDRLLIRTSQDDKGAVVKALDRTSTMAMKAWKRAQGIAIFRNGGGAIGQIGSISTNTITLKTLSDVRFFEQKMSLNSSTTDGTSGAVNAGQITITAINRTTGVLTFSQNVTTGIPAAAANDYLFKAGAFGAMVKGFDAWLPSSVSATTFYGLDRTADDIRLGGIRNTATGLSPREGLMSGAMAAFNNGASPSHAFRHSDDYLNLQLELQSAGVLLMTKEVGAKINGTSFGTPFEGISVAGPSGQIKVFPEYNCIKSVEYILQLDTWELKGAGDFPYFDEGDGNARMMREANADSYEGRIVGDFAFGCSAPGWNVRNAL